jgi:hypothetical protein
VSTLLADSLVPDDVGKTFGVDDEHIPYPDTYWPFSQNGIDAEWHGQGTRSPLERYMAVADPMNALAARAWEHGFHGEGVPNMVAWWGHCPGWTGAATSNAPVRWPVSVRSDGAGGVVPCSAGDMGCVSFEIGDVDALLAEVYLDGPSALIGARCDKKPAQIQRDQYGRIARDGSGCKGLNAGALVVVLGQWMKKKKGALAIDAQNDFNTDQIWNQPAYRYTVNRFTPIDAASAANLVAFGTTTGSLTSYPWNASAQAFAQVDLSIHWVSELGPNTQAVSGTSSTHETRVVAILELSAAATEPGARILGGEYVDDGTVHADRLTVPPFVWLSHGPGPEQVSPTLGGSGHNPYVSPRVVELLVRLGGGGDLEHGPSSPWNARGQPGMDLAAGLGTSEATPIIGPFR